MLLYQLRVLLCCYLYCSRIGFHVMTNDIYVNNNKKKKDVKNKKVIQFQTTQINGFGSSYH